MLPKLSVIFTSLIFASAIVFLWKSPWSPAIPHKVRHKIVQGDVSGAISLLEWRAENAFSDDIKSESYWKAARLTALKLNDFEKTQSLLDRCLSFPEFEHAAEAHALLASTVADIDVETSIIHWTKAIEQDPSNENVGKWWLRIASLYEGEGDHNSAILAWNEAAKRKEVQHTAHLALGRLQLKSDPKMAFTHFESAAEDSSTERSRTAKIGLQLAQWEIDRQEMSGSK